MKSLNSTYMIFFLSCETVIYSRGTQSNKILQAAMTTHFWNIP